MRGSAWIGGIVVGAVLLAGFSAPAGAAGGQARRGPSAPRVVDSDADGMSDALEQALLVQFAPTFLVGRQDCSNVPAEFVAGSETPLVKAENGTIYGQVFPAKSTAEGEPVAEIHFYHLWRSDCRPHGHALDTEHVAVLVKGSKYGQAAEASATSGWKAMYWYAAAHENTVCDVSQIARGSTLKAEDHGARVWISPGKHASYLNEGLCAGGCGSDRCVEMTALKPGKVINLGEPGHPMNDAVFASSDRWPLAQKMAGSNFPAATIARLDRLPEGEIAWFNEGRHPAQGVISISYGTAQAMANAGGATGGAVTTARDSTGGALGKSYRKTVHALGSSVRHVGKALGAEKDKNAQ